MRPDDIKRIAEPVLAHRLTLTPAGLGAGRGSPVDRRGGRREDVGAADRLRGAMTDPIRVTERTTLRWRRTPVVAIGVAGAALLVAAGLAFSRPDVVGIGLPLALTTAWMLVRRPATAELRVQLARAGRCRR